MKGSRVWKSLSGLVFPVARLQHQHPIGPSSPCFERLEPRTLLSATVVDTTLLLTGTELNNAIVIKAGAANGEVIVSGVDGVTNGTVFSNIDAIEIDALGGNDKVTVGKGIKDIAGNLIGVVVRAGEGDDKVAGGEGNDNIDGGGGNDKIDGGKGDDTIDGGEGDDKIDGHHGNDTILGGLGNDKINGHHGDDNIDGGDGDDTIDGHHGNDTILGGLGNDKIKGHHGDDNIDGGEGDDKIDGHHGNDTILGGLGNDKIDGHHGNDNIDGGDGDDIIKGGHGDDTLQGGLGVDQLYGDHGNDTLDGGVGAGDFLNGGKGANTFNDPDDVATLSSKPGKPAKPAKPGVVNLDLSSGVAQLTGTSTSKHDKKCYIFTATTTGMLNITINQVAGRWVEVEVENETNGGDLIELEPHEGPNVGSVPIVAGNVYKIVVKSVDNLPSDYIVDLTVTV